MVLYFQAYKQTRIKVRKRIKNQKQSSLIVPIPVGQSGIMEPEPLDLWFCSAHERKSKTENKNEDICVIKKKEEPQKTITKKNRSIIDGYTRPVIVHCYFQGDRIQKNCSSFRPFPKTP
jgi:hypothetical protein